ncbi:MAG: hypothetical protein A2X58_08780 [Nitrospirae bacterium GWC2_56_14]|nr:MAG: hypothetical protein A2X58_08780 [Nitrospirae bacterium GWC2_56_14]
MRKNRLIVFFSILIAIAAVILGYVAVLYWKGGVNNYEPPKQTYVSSREQVQTDLQNLSKAVEAYFVVHMEYPRKLEQLQPAFLDRIGNDPASGTPYLYALSETNGAGHYRISVPNPKLYNAEDLYLEDGRFYQK